MAGLIKRGKHYYAVYYVDGRERRQALETTSLQIAKERLRNLEVALSGGDLDSLRPTKTPVADVLDAYVEHIRTVKTKNSLKVDLWYLKSIFGPISPALQAPEKYKGGRAGKAGTGKDPRIEVVYIEQLTTAMIAEMLDAKVQKNGIGAKTANRYREILMRLVSWAIDQRGVRMPGGRNPAAKVQRRRQPATQIRFLSLPQIRAQLDALQSDLQLQTMVAVYIYAGLRREEALWLTVDDVDLSAGEYGMIRVRAKTVNGEKWEPKTKVNRVVPISSTLRGYLDRYKPREVPGDWYFPSIKGTRWNADNFYHYLQDANKEAGVSWSCLDYRHTFGSHLAMKGESLYKISTLMGNSPEICRRHYAALLPESLAECVEFERKEQPTRPSNPARPKLRVIASPLSRAEIRYGRNGVFVSDLLRLRAVMAVSPLVLRARLRAWFPAIKVVYLVKSFSLSRLGVFPQSSFGLVDFVMNRHTLRRSYEHEIEKRKGPQPLHQQAWPKASSPTRCPQP